MDAKKFLHPFLFTSGQLKACKSYFFSNPRTSFQYLKRRGIQPLPEYFLPLYRTD